MTYDIPRCDWRNCQGHLGKYEDCVTEALDLLGLDYATDDYGSTEWAVFAMVFEYSEPWQLAPGDIEHYEPTMAGLTIPAGLHVVESDDRGFVYRTTATTDVERAELRARVDAARADWEQWAAGDGALDA